MNSVNSAITSAMNALYQDNSPGTFLVAMTHENERPLQGLSGELDWAFHGEVSSFLRTHRLTGRKDECAYVPFSRHGKTYHVLFLGCGTASAPGHRSALSSETLKILKKNLKGLNAKKVLISAKDFGQTLPSTLQKELGDFSPWIGP